MKLDTLRRDVPTTLILAAALLLFASPVFTASAGAATVSAYILGLIGVAVAGKLLLRPDRWNAWLVAPVGAAIAAMPWIAGFSAASTPTWLHLLVGAAFLARAFWPPARTVRITRQDTPLDDDRATPAP